MRVCGAPRESAVTSSLAPVAGYSIRKPPVMTLAEPFLHMQASLLSSRDGGDAVRRASVLAERIFKQILSTAPSSRAGLGEMIGAAHRDAGLQKQLGKPLIKRLNALNELRKRSVHDKGSGLEELSVDEGQLAVDAVADLLVAIDAFTREQLAELIREAEWQVSAGPEEAVLTLDRVRQRDDFEGLITRPRRLVVLAVHGEAGQGHEHFARVMDWRLRSTPPGRWTEVSVDWPAPSSAPGVRLGCLLETLADTLAVPVALPCDRDPFDDAHADAWRGALQPVWRALCGTRKRFYVRHLIGLLDDGDALLIERYLGLVWTPAVERGGERALVSFEIVRAESAGVPLLTRSWRLGRREKRAAERILDTVENVPLPSECRSFALDELTSISEDDLIRWLRTERGVPRAKAEELASTVISATRGGRFELVVRRVAALTREPRTARRK